jgi:hypothetical protein
MCFPVEMLDAILSGTRDQFSEIGCTYHDFELLQREWTQRVETQADYLIQRIIRANWREPPPGHPFAEKELCEVLVTICHAVLDSLGLNVIGNRLFYFLSETIETADRPSFVWGQLASDLGVENIEEAVGGPSRHERIVYPRIALPGWMPSVSALDSATRESLLKGIWKAEASVNLLNEYSREFDHHIHSRLTEWERECVQRAKWNGLLPLQEGADTPDLVEQLSRLHERTGSLVAWQFVADFLKWKEDGTQTVHSIRRLALITGDDCLRRMIPCRDRSQVQELLSYASTLDKIIRTCSGD